MCSIIITALFFLRMFENRFTTKTDDATILGEDFTPDLGTACVQHSEAELWKSLSKVLCMMLSNVELTTGVTSAQKFPRSALPAVCNPYFGAETSMRFCCC